MNSQRGKASSNASNRRSKRQPNVQAKAQRPKRPTQPARQRSHDAMRASQPNMPTSVASSYGTITPMSTALQRNTRTGHRVVHRELVSGAIAGSVAYTKQLVLQLNPGLSASFPWLSSIASQFEHYTIHKLTLLFVSTSSTSATGAVIIAPEYDPTANDPATETNMTQMSGAIEAPSWQSCRVTLDPQAMHPAGPKKFTRLGNIPGDLRLSDVGKLYVASSGQANTNPIGKVWLEYDVEFFKPQDIAALTQQSRLLTYGTNAVAGAQTFTTTVSTNVVCGLTNDPWGIGPQVSGVWTMPYGTYVIHVDFVGEDSSNEAFTVKLQLYRNGGAISNQQAPLIIDTRNSLGAANAFIPVHLHGVMESSGSDTLSIVANLTGNVGALTCPAGGVFVSIQAI